MKRKEISQILKNLEESIGEIKDPIALETMSIQFNLIEVLISKVEDLSAEVQRLRDENNRLKGEQGKPKIKPNKKDGDISSETERKNAEKSTSDESQGLGFKLDKSSLEKLKEQRLPIELLEQLESLKGQKYDNEAVFLEAIESCLGYKLEEETKILLLQYANYKKRNRKPKLPDIKIDREEKCPVDKSELPEDAIFKGYESKVVQDVVIETDNVKFSRESYYSPSLSKTYLGKVPLGYEGDYGPNINSQIVSMTYINNMSIPKIHEFYGNIAIIISRSYISSRLTKPEYMDVFHDEKSQMYEASLEVSRYQQIDDTGSRVNGKNHYTQIVCNPLSTLFFTTKRKDRLTILDVLRNFGARSFIFNTETFMLLDKLKVPHTATVLMRDFEQDIPFDEQRMQEILKEVFSDPSKGQSHRVRTMEACAIACYHQETDLRIVRLLIGDDAPQFKLIAENLALCWVHDGRHYKRISPIVGLHQEQLSMFLHSYWEYYGKLFTYKQNPSPEQSEILSSEFDSLFSTKTGYDQLDERIAKTKNKKNELLVVLKYPEIPLHNNRSENGARVQKRRADVSLQTKSEEGTRAKDTMMSIVETCKKLGISSYEFIEDRVSRKFKLPSLAKIIRTKSANQAALSNTS